jgi:hypothetical protein
VGAGGLLTRPAERVTRVRFSQYLLTRPASWKCSNRRSADYTICSLHPVLTQKGREWFGRKQGAHLKPGVKKSKATMTPQDMRRKGSWAVRFYGRKGRLPPLIKPDSTPTRYALTARAWGEPVPKTVAAARKIAAKGRSLLEAYARSRAKAR